MLSFTSNHKVMSISVCSNIPGYTSPLCLVSNGNVDELMEGFVIYLELLSSVAKQLCLKQFENIFNDLETVKNDQLLSEKNFQSMNWSNQKVYNNRSIENLKLQLESYFSELPVIGFNSQKYDINCMRTPLVRNLLKHDKIQFVIKRNNAMKCIKTKHLKFLDIINFIAPGFSYANFIKAYNCSMKKGFFPYEYVTSLEKLNENSLPAHEAFYSSLTQSNITAADYQNCKQVWQNKSMLTMKDYLIYYNNLDVLPFLEAVEKQHMVYREKGIDMFKDGISVPSLATKWLFNESNTTNFSIPLIGRKDADLYKTIRNNIIGGPSIVFHRYHEADKTFIRKNSFDSKSKVCKNVFGFDANALYLYCAMQELPTGSIIRRRKENNFRPKFCDYFGRLSVEWLEYCSYLNGVFIQHKYNKGEQKVGQHGLPVDGYCKQLKTVFQFHGCLFHGHKCVKTKGVVFNPINGKSMTSLHQDTKIKESYIRALGYRLEVIYECQWESYKKFSKHCKDFVASFFSREMEENKSMTEKDILNAVENNLFYGFVECDLYVPDSLKSKFSEMTPIFKHASLSRSDLSEDMLKYAVHYDMLKQAQKTLIGSYYGKKILVLTPLLRWYLSHGLCVSNIYQVVQFKRHKCFVKFGESVCQMRRNADKDSSMKILAETSKLCGNVIYGATITNKERFTDVKFVSNLNAAQKLVGSKHFMSVEELDDELFEIQMSKERIKLDTPIVIGFSILQLAKLRMLEFYYDLMLKYFDRSDFEYVQMDTDSAYFAMSGDFEDLVIPQKRHQFFDEYDKWFVPEFCDTHKTQFVECKVNFGAWKMSNCCKESFNFHRRTPGLFKQEFRGKGIIALNSKTYFCFGDEGNKLSTKGIMKRCNDIKKEEFLNVLNNKSRVHGTNRGIMRRNNKVMTYNQTRAGLSFFYAKRKVHSDGVTTFPLDM